MDPQRRAVDVSEVDQISRLDIVHLDSPVEAPRVLGGDEVLELALAGAPVEAAGDEDRLVLRPHAQALELVDRGRERVAARIVGCAGKRQLRRLDHERDRAARLRQRLERRAREREPERVAHR